MNPQNPAQFHEKHDEPQLAVVMVTPKSYETCRTTISYLLKQTALAQMELIIVAPTRVDLELIPQEVEAFGAFQVVEIGKLVSTGRAMAEGFRAARAPIVVYGEQHSYPEPAWAEAILRAHQAPHAVVGAAMGNANPQSLVSWAHLFGQFGPVITPAHSGAAKYLGAHHAAYKRAVVLEYGEMLGELLDNECALHIDLRARGHTLYLENRAISNHVNTSRLAAYCRLDYLGQRGFAAARAEVGKWSRAKRVLYAAACPLVPIVRMGRIVRDIFRARRAGQLLPQILFPISAALVCGMVGEAVGYLFGEKIEAEKIVMELDRLEFVSESDRAALKNPVTM